MSITKKSSEKLIPDATGGWYWLKRPGEKWEPVLVAPATNSHSATILVFTDYPLHRHGSSIPVEDVKGEWGPELPPPPDS